MLISMTGFGQAAKSTAEFEISVEVKAVNNRSLRISTRIPECASAIEPEIERAVRDHVARGTVNVSLRVSAVGRSNRYQLDNAVLQGYWSSLRAVASQMTLSEESLATNLLSLPGVVADRFGDRFDVREQWPLIDSVLTDALNAMTSFRKAEGQVMADGLAQLCNEMRRQLDIVRTRTKELVLEYRDKLIQRVTELLAGTVASISPADIVRDVAIYADRSDINEEITRLTCHLDQFIKLLSDRESQGRRLDFLSQEMVREINTIGSKTADVQAAHCVVEMKLAAERIKEILQNVE